VDVIRKIGASILLIFLILAALSSEVGSSSSLQIIVSTDKPYYCREENINVYGDVRVDGVPVENATVALEVRDSASSPVVVRTLTTNFLGKYYVSFKMSDEALLGMYTVNASYNYDAERVTNTTSFVLEAASLLVLTVMVGRSAYSVGDTIEIYGDVTRDNAPVNGAFVAVEVRDSKNAPIVMRVLETDNDGVYSLTFQLTQGSPTGTYNVHASVSYESLKAVSNTTFEVSHEISADLNGDGVVNILDLAIVAIAWGSYPGHPRWNERCDLDGNEIINIIDITLVAREYGK